MSILNKKNNFYVLFIKRILDIMFSFLLLILAMPIIIISSIFIAIDTMEFPIFIQKRPGFKGKIFKLYKLKSMKSQYDSNGVLLGDFERLTKSGNIIRKLSLDELPQLWNILIGDMSFIGPRPLLVEYLPLYSKEQNRRHDVLPGITGWAQINGRNTISWDEKFKFDVFYVENISFFLDLNILLKTISNLIKREGINSSLDDTMPDFLGNGDNK